MKRMCPVFGSKIEKSNIYNNYSSCLKSNVNGYAYNFLFLKMTSHPLRNLLRWILGQTIKLKKTK